MESTHKELKRWLRLWEGQSYSWTEFDLDVWVVGTVEDDSAQKVFSLCVCVWKSLMVKKRENAL